MKDQWPNHLEFYPDLDLMTPELIAYRDRSTQWLYHLYFTSIFKHGAAMFLGSILAINAIERKNNHSNNGWISNWIKIIIGCILFYVPMDLRMDMNYWSPLWTFTYDKLFIIAVYLVLDAILSIYQFQSNEFMKRMIRSCLFKKFLIIYDIQWRFVLIWVYLVMIEWILIHFNWYLMLN